MFHLSIWLELCMYFDGGKSVKQKGKMREKKLIGKRHLDYLSGKHTSMCLLSTVLTKWWAPFVCIISYQSHLHFFLMYHQFHFLSNVQNHDSYNTTQHTFNLFLLQLLLFTQWNSNSVRLTIPAPENLHWSFVYVCTKKLKKETRKRIEWNGWRDENIKRKS